MSPLHPPMTFCEDPETPQKGTFLVTRKLAFWWAPPERYLSGGTFLVPFWWAHQKGTFLSGGFLVHHSPMFCLFCLAQLAVFDTLSHTLGMLTNCTFSSSLRAYPPPPECLWWQRLDSATHLSGHPCHFRLRGGCTKWAASSIWGVAPTCRSRATRPPLPTWRTLPTLHCPCLAIKLQPHLDFFATFY